MADRVRKYRGFSLLEMVVSVAILMILMAISAPYLMNAVYAMRLRYTAVDLSGLMQKARIDAGPEEHVLLDSTGYSWRWPDHLLRG